MSFNAIQLSCLAAKDAGLHLIRGPWFIRHHAQDTSPLAVNGLGAVLWHHSQILNPHSWRWLQTFLQEDESWLYRFSFGWDQNRALRLTHHKTFHDLGPEEVSNTAKAMAHQLAV